MTFDSLRPYLIPRASQEQDDVVGSVSLGRWIGTVQPNEELRREPRACAFTPRRADNCIPSKGRATNMRSANLKEIRLGRFAR